MLRPFTITGATMKLRWSNATARSNNPHFSPGYWMLGLVQEQMGDPDESAAALQRAVELTPHSVRMHAALGRLFALSGREREARAILKQLRGQSQIRYVCLSILQASALPWVRRTRDWIC